MCILYVKDFPKYDPRLIYEFGRVLKMVSDNQNGFGTNYVGYEIYILNRN